MSHPQPSGPRPSIQMSSASSTTNPTTTTTTATIHTAMHSPSTASSTILYRTHPRPMPHTSMSWWVAGSQVRSLRYELRVTCRNHPWPEIDVPPILSGAAAGEHEQVQRSLRRSGEGCCNICILYMYLHTIHINIYTLPMIRFSTTSSGGTQTLTST